MLFLSVATLRGHCHVGRSRARDDVVLSWGKKKKTSRYSPTPSTFAMSMTRASAAIAATAAAKNSANPTRSLQHLQQVRFTTQASDSLRALAPAATAASEARSAQEQIVRDWTAEKDNLQLNVVNRRQNLRSCITRRTASLDFHRPTAMLDSAAVLRRAETPAQMAAAISTLRELRQSLLSDAEFWTAVQEATWIAEIAALLHIANPAHWQSVSQSYSFVPADLWTVVEPQLTLLTEPGGIPQRLELVVCLEILNGPGSMADKLGYIQSVAWHFEVEDVFTAVTLDTPGIRPRGVWRPLQHEFVSLDLDHRAITAIRADLMRRAGNGYHNPETVPDSPDEVWRSTFRKLTRRALPSPGRGRSGRPQAASLLGRRREGHAAFGAAHGIPC